MAKMNNEFGVNGIVEMIKGNFVTCRDKLYAEVDGEKKAICRVVSLVDENTANYSLYPVLKWGERRFSSDSPAIDRQISAKHLEDGLNKIGARLSTSSAFISPDDGERVVCWNGSHRSISWVDTESLIHMVIEYNSETVEKVYHMNTMVPYGNRVAVIVSVSENGKPAKPSIEMLKEHKMA